MEVKWKQIVIYSLLIVVLFFGIYNFRNLSLAFLGYGPGLQDFSKNITNGYVLYRTSSHEIFVAPENGWNDKVEIIPSKVLKVNYYNEFILVERQGLKMRKPNDSLDLYKIPDENVMNYWILDTKKNYSFKNLTRIEFQEKLKLLKIPEVKLIDVYDY